MQSRISSLQQRMQQMQLDAYYCRNTSDIRWLTGFCSTFDSEAAHLILVTADDAVLHTDARYSEAMRVNPVRENLEINDEPKTHYDFAAAVLTDCKPEGAKLKLGIEANLALSEYRKLVGALEDAGVSCEIVEVESPVLALREVKDASEVQLMRRAQQITDAAFEDLLTWVKPGLTEKQVASRMEYKMRELGAGGLAFATIAAAGPHSSMPHAVPSDRQLQKGDFVVLDFGARYEDYCADMTRTICIGKPTAEMQRIYNTVLQAQTQCKQAVRAGASKSELHNLAKSIIDDAGYANRFTHSLGHGVGIDIHEMPTLSAKASGSLVCGNVITVEPGIYVPGVGGVRIEDYGVVTQDGLDTFTASSHELQII